MMIRECSWNSSIRHWQSYKPRRNWKKNHAEESGLCSMTNKTRFCHSPLSQALPLFSPCKMHEGRLQQSAVHARCMEEDCSNPQSMHAAGRAETAFLGPCTLHEERKQCFLVPASCMKVLTHDSCLMPSAPNNKAAHEDEGRLLLFYRDSRVFCFCLKNFGSLT